MKRCAFLLFLLMFSHLARAAEPLPLEKSEAKQILEGMAWTEVSVVAIRQGVDSKGNVAPIYASMVAVGKLDGQYRSTCQTVFFDKDLGWHVMELAEKSVKIWTSKGYQEFTPWRTW